MKYQVPQFLDIEDKIIGPFSVKQFIYLVGGAGMGYLAWRFFPIPYLGIPVGVSFVGLGAALGFYKYNGRPFILAVESAYNFYKSERLYIWRRKEKKAETDLDITNFKPTKHGVGLLVPRSSSKLSDLSWSIDVKKEGEVADKKVHTDN